MDKLSQSVIINFELYTEGSMPKMSLTNEELGLELIFSPGLHEEKPSEEEDKRVFGTSVGGMQEALVGLRDGLSECQDTRVLGVTRKREFSASPFIEGGESGAELIPKHRYSLNQMINKKFKGDGQTTKNAISFDLINSVPKELSTSVGCSSSSTHEPSSIQDRPSSSTIDARVRHWRFLFDKTLSISDVSDLNRLMIPKRFAELHFPSLKKEENSYKKEALKFSDDQNVTWDMNFEYWPTSQNYVITKGWKAFVKRHNLQPNYKVSFYEIEQQLDNKHYGIDYEIGVPVKIIRLFGQDIRCDECNGVGDHGGRRRRVRNRNSSSSSSHGIRSK